jgi:hypothetical protein
MTSGSKRGVFDLREGHLQNEVDLRLDKGGPEAATRLLGAIVGDILNRLDALEGGAQMYTAAEMEQQRRNLKSTVNSLVDDRLSSLPQELKDRIVERLDDVSERLGKLEGLKEEAGSAIEWAYLESLDGEPETFALLVRLAKAFGKVPPTVSPTEQELIIRYEEDKRKEWRFRDLWMCLCGHKGIDHDKDEVGECGRCGCAAFQHRCELLKVVKEKEPPPSPPTKTFKVTVTASDPETLEVGVIKDTLLSGAHYMDGLDVEVEELDG